MHKKFRLMVLLFSLTIAPPLFAQDWRFQSSLEKAQAGDANEQNGLGIAYSEGLGVRPNQKLAVYWFRKSAEAGDVGGACNLGLHYFRGWGVKGNLTLMFKWFFAANALDGLSCNPGDVPPKFRRPRSMARGWKLAEAWLRAHPDFKNDFGDRPWMSDSGKYPITMREHGDSIQLPYKNPARKRQRP